MITAIVFLGPPGAGKGTHAKEISSILNIPHISTGDIFRDAVKNQTELGKKVKEYLDSGKLVPDELVWAVVEERLNKEDCKNGFILDGFPRTIPQAEMLEEFLRKNNTVIKVIYLDAPDELVVERLSSRRICKNCGAIYNIISMPPKEDNKCDICGGELYQRSDDQPEVIKKRLDTYYQETKSLIDFYNSKSLMYTISVKKEREEIVEEILKVVKNGTEE
ncbi:MAG TPA: adenylate kinase [Dictyoglomaceae bacterium]|nr:adenylate kinase [Dictyoglomaceae bacterium]HOL38818.1 adenylate kinase [Dictyoglomaceae bacterium]HPP15434.1 adenylate kinase [Dictyoglomaceae bacterium]